ncbi:fungal-specific transcription factor domain-containing protein [Aspergillus cavernicola]|uniref:Fungal-specific transcription factor domain-containing protein n=1 Tax=Aspergillus cavernicola TaxID=176166 RepID=A0ABR4IMA9_9EURO
MASYLDDQIDHDIASHQSGQYPTSHHPTQATRSLGSGDSSFVPRPKRIACAVCRRRKLRCDGRKPSCGTCSRLGHECTYDEARKKSGPKRGYVKQLEARLAQVETMLKTQDPPVPQTQGPNFPATLPNVPTGMTEMHAMGNSMSNSISPTEGAPATGPVLAFTPEGVNAANSFGWDMISLGLEEPLPAREVMDELNQIYFEKTHAFVPIIHRPRYMAAMDFAPNSRPPACLQYIIWCHAAAVSEKYSDLHPLFYQRARKYAELDQMKGLGENTLNISHCQTWILIGSYEYKMMFFPRAWISTGVAARISIMLGLNRLDGEGLEVKQCLPPARDWVETEERRRTFWMMFNIDRYASIGTGWPTCIDERDIMTNLPASEEAFVNGKPEKTARLSDVLCGEELATLSPFASVAFISCLLGRNLTHLHRPDPQDNDNDLNGVFWQRHRSHDNILLHFALSMPSHLRLPAGVTDSNVLFCNLAVHTSTVCLHQAAIFKAEKNGMPEQIILESKRRCIVAADQISSIMKMVSSMDISKMNPFISFCVYVAARVFVQYLKFRPDDMAARSSLQFVFSVLDALKRQNPLTESFLVQLEVDIEGTPFQDIRLVSNQQPSQNSFFKDYSYGETDPKLTSVPSQRQLALSLSRGGDNACSAWDPTMKPHRNTNGRNISRLPTRERSQPARQSTDNFSSNRAPQPPNMNTSNLPGFSKAPFIPGESTSGALFNFEPPSRFHDVTNSLPESSTPSTMHSSSSASFMRTDQSSSPKQSQPPSSSSVQDPAPFDSANLTTQFIEPSSTSTPNTDPTTDPLFVIGPLNSSSPAAQTQTVPSTWNFPINVTGDPNNPNAEVLDLMTTDMDGFSGAQWAHILGSGGWNP